MRVCKTLVRKSINSRNQLTFSVTHRLNQDAIIYWRFDAFHLTSTNFDRVSVTDLRDSSPQETTKSYFRYARVHYRVRKHNTENRKMNFGIVCSYGTLENQMENSGHFITFLFVNRIMFSLRHTLCQQPYVSTMTIAK